MKTNITIQFRNGNYSGSIDLPNNCPHCGQVMVPFVYGAFSSDNSGDDHHIIGVLARCSFMECNNFFSLRYLYNWDTRTMISRYELIPDDYRPPIEVDLPENIEHVSSEFVEIYSQATKAEYEKLNRIAGVGYRKALEFLIKDYAISNNIDDKEEIEKMPLGKVIEKYLTDFSKLQKLAKAATWLGNDETHYVRKHTDKDIRDMIAFIKSAAQFIAADYDANVAEKFLNE